MVQRRAGLNQGRCEDQQQEEAAMAAKMLIEAKKKKTPPCLSDKTMLGVNRETMRFQSH